MYEAHFHPKIKNKRKEDLERSKSQIIQCLCNRKLGSIIDLKLRVKISRLLLGQYTDSDTLRKFSDCPLPTALCMY